MKLASAVLASSSALVVSLCALCACANEPAELQSAAEVKPAEVKPAEVKPAAGAKLKPKPTAEPKIEAPSIPGLSKRSGIHLPNVFDFSLSGQSLRISLPADYVAVEPDQGMIRLVNGSDPQTLAVLAILDRAQESLESAKEIHAMTGAKVVEAEADEQGWQLVVRIGENAGMFTSEVVRNIADTHFTCTATALERSALDAPIAACMTLAVQPD